MTTTLPTDLGASIKAEWKMTTIDICEIVRETEKAVLVDLSFDFDGANDERWLPKSLIASIEKNTGEGFALTVPTWFAIKERL